MGLLKVLWKKCRNQADFSYNHPNTLWDCEDRDVLHLLYLKNCVLTLVCRVKYRGPEFGIDSESLFLGLGICYRSETSVDCLFLIL